MELFWLKLFADFVMRESYRMTDEQLALQAVSDAQRILE